MSSARAEAEAPFVVAVEAASDAARTQLCELVRRNTWPLSREVLSSPVYTREDGSVSFRGADEEATRLSTNLVKEMLLLWKRMDAFTGSLGARVVILDGWYGSDARRASKILDASDTAAYALCIPLARDMCGDVDLLVMEAPEPEGQTTAGCIARVGSHALHGCPVVCVSGKGCLGSPEVGEAVRGAVVAAWEATRKVPWESESPSEPEAASGGVRDNTELAEPSAAEGHPYREWADAASDYAQAIVVPLAWLLLAWVVAGLMSSAPAAYAFPAPACRVALNGTLWCPWW